MRRGATGVGTGGVERTPAAMRREQRKRIREELDWAARSGAVTVRHDPSIVRPSRPEPTPR